MRSGPVNSPAMPSVFPFAAIQYRAALSKGADLSALIAPPYDVLDTQGKAKLLARSADNIVSVDLPQIPAKKLGLPAVYAAAAAKLSEMLTSGALVRREPCLFAYRQSFTSGTGGKTIHRSGMIAAVQLQPFGPAVGGGVLPHEETFSGPKEDRLALMRATGMQLSPIFGLHADEEGSAAKLLAHLCTGQPDVIAQTDDGTKHEVWAVTDAATIGKYQAMLEGQDVFIADGHHRYTTQLNYVRELEEACGAALAADDSARRCMFVLISMAEPGLVIWPTHRVLAGMSGYSWEALMLAAGKHLTMEPIAGGLHSITKAMESRDGMGPRRFALYDVASASGCVVAPAHADPLAARFAAKPKAWRDLTVAFVQHILVEGVCEPVLNEGHPVTWAFPHTVPEVEAICKGQETGAGGGAGFAPQLAILVRPTPLDAVREVSRAGELMPQKSTFFYPKIATGIALNRLR